MGDLDSFNFELIAGGEAKVRAASAALLYGKAVFTTIAILGGRPFLWEKHWHRLTENAVRVGLDIERYQEAAVLDELVRCLKANETDIGRARITIAECSPGELWGGKNGQSDPVIFIMTGPIRQKPPVLKLTASPYAVNTASPLSGIKS